jgi:DNA topoisomerase-1
VQSPALRLIVERELEIEKFKRQEYWTVHLDSHKNHQPFSAKLFQYQGKKLEQLSIGSQQEYDAIHAKLNDAKLPPKVVRVEKKAKQRNAAAPFTTSTLQQEAVRKLGLSAERTMRIAQQLYEGVDIGGQTVGLITYMRTDSVNLAKEAVQDIRDYIAANFASDYLPKSAPVYKSKAKNAQEAHEAIRPTAIARTPDAMRAHLTVDQARLYEMIWKRTLACQMAPARFDTVSLDIRLGGDDTLFRASGQTLVFPGFIAVYQEDTDDSEEEENSKLPPLAEGETIPLDKLYGEQHFTQPPPRYSEASLVKTLEEYGIGRPSTYASIISTLQAREYVVLDKKRFMPTDVGRVVNKFLTEHFTRYVDYGFTANLEDELDEISDGKRDWIPVLKEFWDGFHTLIGDKKDVSRPGTEILDELCPKCGKPLSKRLGKRGSFIGCTGYPECDYTRNLDGTDADAGEARKELGIQPESKQPVLLLRGPYGHYVQLGEVVEGEKTKPKRVSWPRELPLEQADLATALKLLALPRELGAHPETGKKIIVNIGRLGPYIGHDGKFKSIPRGESIFDIKLDRAVELLAQAKAGNTVLRTLGEHPDDKAPIEVCSGRYGPYVRHGKVNATLPKNITPEEITLEQALELIAEKAAKGGSKAKAPAKKAAAKTKTAKPKAETATKAKTATKTAAKKPAAKKTAVKKTKA